MCQHRLRTAYLGGNLGSGYSAAKPFLSVPLDRILLVFEPVALPAGLYQSRGAAISSVDIRISANVVAHWPSGG
jgi:hypothetical protein